MREQIQNGVPFSDALAEHAQVFPPYYIGILRSSELTGQLDTSLEQLSGYIERDVEAKSTIKSALVYPMVVIGMSIVTVVDPRRVRAAEVHEVLQGPRTRSCRCRRGCCSASPTSCRSSGSCGSVCSLGVRAAL